MTEKTLAQKVQELLRRAEQEKAKRIYIKNCQLDEKYKKMLGVRKEKLATKQETESSRAVKKIIRQVDTVTKRKIRDAKGLHPTITRVGKKTASEIKKRLLTLIQKYCRLRDTDEKGYGKCISCESIRHYKGMDGGHYISRAVNITAFDERNINGQCRRCNGLLHGNRDGYRLGMIEKYGKGVVEELESKRRTISKVNIDRMCEKIKLYTEMINDLESKKQSGGIEM